MYLLPASSSDLWWDQKHLHLYLQHRVQLVYRAAMHDQSGDLCSSAEIASSTPQQVIEVTASESSHPARQFRVAACTLLST